MIILLAINKNYFLTKCPPIDDIVLQKHNLNAFFIPFFAKFIVILIQGAKAWRSIGAQLLPSVLLFSNFQRPFDKSILKHQHTENTAAKWWNKHFRVSKITKNFSILNGRGKVNNVSKSYLHVTFFLPFTPHSPFWKLVWWPWHGRINCGQVGQFREVLNFSSKKVSSDDYLILI